MNSKVRVVKRLLSRVPRVSLEHRAFEMLKSSLLWHYLAFIKANTYWLSHRAYHNILKNLSIYINSLSNPLYGNKL